MLARIRHVAIYTENYHRTASFYKSVFGMKKITTGMTDETGNYDPSRGHLSDGVIGLALLQRHPGTRSGLDHFGFEVQDIEAVRARLKENADLRIAKSLEHVPFSVMRIQDPAGTHIDVSQKGVAKVREGYLEEGWEQPRHLSHIAIRAGKPSLVADFYRRVFELRDIESPPNGRTACLSDGKVSFLILPCECTSYRTMTEGLDHIGFRVDDLERVKREIDELSRTDPESAPRKIDVGRFGKMTKSELEGCVLGQHALSDPDGVLLDLSE